MGLIVYHELNSKVSIGKFRNWISQRLEPSIEVQCCFRNRHFDNMIKGHQLCIMLSGSRKKQTLGLKIYRSINALCTRVRPRIATEWIAAHRLWGRGPWPWRRPPGTWRGQKWGRGELGIHRIPPSPVGGGGNLIILKLNSMIKWLVYYLLYWFFNYSYQFIHFL